MGCRKLSVNYPIGYMDTNWRNDYFYVLEEVKCAVRNRSNHNTYNARRTIKQELNNTR